MHLFVAVAALALAANPPAPAKEAKERHTPAKGTMVLGSITSGKATFDVSVGNCVAPKGAPAGTPADCAVLVSLKGKGGKPQQLEWTAKPGAVYQQGERSVAIGDEADTAMAVSWNKINVAKGIDGVIVTQQAGGDRVKRRHDVFLSIKGKLNYAMTAAEPRGPMTWSSVTPLDMDKNGTEELIVLQAATPDEEAEADSWEVTVYGWRADIQRIVKLPTWTPTLQAAVVGMFGTLAQAREQKKNKCLREFVVVDNKSAPLLPDNTFFVAYMASTQADADLALEQAKACDESIVGAVKVVQRGMDVPE